MNYQRDIKISLLIYQVTLVLLLIACLTIIAFKALVYLSFTAVTYFIRDFAFPIHFVSITEETLTVKRLFLGGLFVKKSTLNRNKIIQLINIDTGVTTASEIDFEYGIFSGGDGTDEKKFELYRIKFLDVNGAEKTIKIPMAAVEAKILSARLLPTTSGLPYGG